MLPSKPAPIIKVNKAIAGAMLSYLLVTKLPIKTIRQLPSNPPARPNSVTPPEVPGGTCLKVKISRGAIFENTPIFAITASDYDLTEAQAQSLGFTGFMLKPLDPDVFKKKIANPEEGA